MASSEHLETLRERNKELLEQLKQVTEELQSIKLPRTCKTAANKAQGSPASVCTEDLLLVQNKQRYQVSLNQRNGRFVSNAFRDTVNVSVETDSPDVARRSLCKVGTRMQTRKTSKPAGKNSLILATNKKRNASTSAEHVFEQGHVPTDTTYDNSLQEQENISLHGHFNTIEQIQPKPIPSQNMYQKGMRQVTILSPNQDLDSILQLDRQRVQPLLGYDWIAGLLDAESSLTEHSEQFFSELRTFRQVNKEECVHSQLSRLPGVGDPLNFPLEEEVTEQQHTPDTHQCTFCYRINSRLFATPLDPQAVCPMCKMPKANHPHTEKEPAFIRVSIPRSTLLPASKYKAHRRCSFDPSDSLGLPSHCLSGWLNITQKAGSQMSSLDLRSSMEVKPDLDTVSSQQDLSVSRVSGSRRSDQLLDISRLARYRFQHLNTWRDKPNKRY